MAFASNIYFATKTGYFDKDIASNPLLHTWSLGVEEQFYLFIPLLLYFGYRFARGRSSLGLVLIALFVLSLIFSVAGAKLAPTASFYLIPFRTWELLTGTLLAFFSLPRISSRYINEAICWLGLALLAVGVFGFDETTPFPSFWAIIPCLGAAMIIFSGAQPTLVAGRLLSWKPLVGIGLISYSLYLWHWPVIVFWEFYHFTTIGILEKAVIVSVSLVLGWASWRYIETPVRTRPFWSRSRLFIAAGVGSIAIMGAGFGIAKMRGFPQRFPGVTSEWSAKDRSECLYGKAGRSLVDIERGNYCLIGKYGRPTFILWGDSHAEALRPAIDLAANNGNVSGIFAGYASCGPMLGLVSRTAGRSDDCQEFNKRVLRYVSEHPVQTVILSARWVTKFDGSWRLANGRKAGDYDDAYTALVDTAQQLRRLGKRVIIVGQPPEPGFVVPRALYRFGAEGEQLDALRPRPGSAEPAFAANRMVRRAAIESGAEYVDLSEALCRGGECKVFDADMPLYYDEHHLSTASGRSIAPLFNNLLSSGLAAGEIK